MVTKYRVEAEGQVFTRTSVLTYTHVIIGRRNTRYPGATPDIWVALNWAGRPDLAAKKVTENFRRGWSEVKAVGVAPSVTGAGGA
jgi:hypothetical protein